MNHVVIGVGVPRAIDRRVGIVWPGSKRKNGEGPSLIGYEKAVSVRDVFLSINVARIPVGPLSRIPIRLHERPSMLIRALNEIKVVRRGDRNLHAAIISMVLSLHTSLPVCIVNASIMQWVNLSA